MSYRLFFNRRSELTAVVAFVVDTARRRESVRALVSDTGFEGPGRERIAVLRAAELSNDPFAASWFGRDGAASIRGHPAAHRGIELLAPGCLLDRDALGSLSSEAMRLVG